jgi:hypothetical protein
MAGIMRVPVRRSWWGVVAGALVVAGCGDDRSDLTVKNALLTEAGLELTTNCARGEKAVVDEVLNNGGGLVIEVTGVNADGDCEGHATVNLTDDERVSVLAGAFVFTTDGQELDVERE